MIKKSILTPFQKFIKIESFSGILLFSVTIIALIWANSPWADAYQSLFQYEIGIRTEDFEFTKPLILWINDGLMTVFFFLIGLEIKRELLIGELNTFRKASFPLFAAAGGMLVPMAIFLLLNSEPETVGGWGIPMATDIAFTLAILKVLGNRIPLNLKIFLTAFAIVDDLGAVMVIAIFYSTGIDWMLILYALLLLVPLAILGYKEKYYKTLTWVVGLAIWFLFLKSGIHPTIAGVLLAFTIPVRQKIDMRAFVDQLYAITKQIKITDDSTTPVLSKEQIDEVDNLKDLTVKFNSPLQYLEHKLHDWAAFFIMPVFALANAGIVFSADMNLDTALVMNIALALFLGKFLGVSLMSMLSIKLKMATLPQGVNFTQIIGVSILAGVGFTMSIFIANLAFPTSTILVDSSKVGIILGSLISGIIGFLILRFGSKQVKVE